MAIGLLPHERPYHAPVSYRFHHLAPGDWIKVAAFVVGSLGLAFFRLRRENQARDSS